MFLAEHVTTLPDGLFNVLNGGLKILYRPQFPATLGAVLVAIIDFPEDYVSNEEVPIEVLIASLDDAEVFGRAEGTVAMPRNPELDDRLAALTLALNLYHIQLSRPGVFKLSASLAGQPPQVLLFQVR